VESVEILSFYLFYLYKFWPYL